MDDKIILGSGHVYIIDKDSTSGLDGDMTNAEVKTFIATYAVDTNLAGHIKNGATFNYSAAKYTEKDDFSETTKTVTTDETASLAFGFIDYKTGLMDKLIDTATTTSGTKDELVSIGGIANASGKKYVVIFAHEDAADNDVYLIVCGTNTADLAAAFAQGAGTNFAAQFNAEPFDDSGRKAYFYRCEHGYVNAQG